MMTRSCRAALAAPFLLSCVASVTMAQVPNRDYADAFELPVARTQPALSYTVSVDARDLTGFGVELVVRHAPDTLRFAIPIWAPGAYRVANFHRNLRDVRVTSGGRDVPVIREDSSVWRAVPPNGEATIRYRVQFPSAAAARAPNNRSFLRETGALIDGPAAFVYLTNHKLAPVHVRFDIPAGWRIATGLVPTADPQVFAANSYDVLIDSPVLIGSFRDWNFAVDGVPHRVAFWQPPDAPGFDTTRFVDAIRRIVETAREIMTRLPYRDYTFIYVDGAGGGLEHLNSTTIGIGSDELRSDPLAHASVTAHEFFHLWNVKRVRPAVLGPFDYQHPVRTTDLWWSEGVTDYFAEEILRRAGLVSERATLGALRANIQSYLRNPAHTRISPERSSWSAWDTPRVNGGYGISYYLQGALLGELLELQLRASTGNARGMDDVERLLFDRFAGARGFTGEDLLHAVNEICGCDLQPFFEAHVSGAEEIDFDRYLRAAGLRVGTTPGPAVDSAGRAAADRRIGVLTPAGYGSAGGAAGGRLRLSVGDPTSAWGRAGLITGDELVSLSGATLATPAEFRSAIEVLPAGAEVTVAYLRGVETHVAKVKIDGYSEVRVTIEPVTELKESQRELRRAWLGSR
jgi:predicted metalloprotease with PDZ domain